MPLMNFDLEDGNKPVSFNLNVEDSIRFMKFMEECDKLQRDKETPHFEWLQVRQRISRDNQLLP